MNETNIASIVFGIVAGFYSTVFLLFLSDVVHLNKEVMKMKYELDDIKNQTITFNRSFLIDSPKNILLLKKSISGKICFSYNEQRQILEYINFICNMAILLFGSYSIYIHGIGTHHGLAYHLIYFVFKLCTIVLSVWLNLYFEKGLPSDIFLYIWIDVNCVASIMQAIRQSLIVATQRRINLIRPSLIIQHVRYDGSDSYSSTNQNKSEKQSDPSKGSNLNKTKTSDKKQKVNTTDDTKQPGTTRKDWNKPNQVVSNDPPYGKGGGSIDTHNPDRGKK
ncbi:unnamed protein product [Adineta steineri]|uniref:Transmembrane protein n=1 Tax=Adineta steineri TaxID=433720 RepID=A0A813T3F5_9BILA|nr:unnamed protein product [Adineta steineri]